MSKVKSLEMKNEKLQKQFKGLQEVVVDLFAQVIPAKSTEIEKERGNEENLSC